MSNDDYPYVNFMNILYGHLERIDLRSLADACEYDWYNQTLCEVNDSVVRLGVLKGEYHWHKHDDNDEFFFTLEGMLLVDIEGREAIALHPWQGCVVPKGVVHRTRAPERTVVIMIENTGIEPTGDD